MSKTASSFYPEFDASKFMDMSKMLRDFKMPGLDLQAAMEAQQKNFQAWASAGQVAAEGMQAVARRQSELFRQTMQETSELMNEVIASSTPEEKVTKQAELTKVALDRALANAREIAEMVTKSNAEAMEVISDRVGESLEELRGIMKPAKATK